MSGLRRLALAAATVGALALAGCAGRGLIANVGPDAARPQAGAPAAWQAPLPRADAPAPPHGGDPGTLRQWWARLGDPTLLGLIDAAQAASPSLAQAAANVAQARAEAVAAGAAGVPALEAIASANRAAFTFGGPAAFRTQLQAGAQASWEIDLFGGLARGREAAASRLGARLAQWDDARVALAAEVADAYANHRFCELQVRLAQADAQSRAITARLTAAAGEAGLQAPATVALARASAADAAATLTRQRAQCDQQVKALVALTALDEGELRQRLAEGGREATLPAPAALQVDAVPARVLAQRPDVAAAEGEVAAASADIGAAEAQRFPRLSLAGSVTPTRVSINGGPTLALTTWAIGPSLSLPLFDGGRRVADVEAARARYAAAESKYRATVRGAVREVEDALVRLASVQAREADVRAAARDYGVALEAATVRQRAGLGSLIEQEDARRTALAAEAAVTALEYERLAAWIALYRAVGGGWTETTPASAAAGPRNDKDPR